MKKIKPIFYGAILIAVVIASWLAQYHSLLQVRFNDDSLRHQASVVAGQAAKNRQLSNAVALAQNRESLSAAELKELLQLRNEIGRLQAAAKTMEQLRRRLQRLHDRRQDAEEELARGPDHDLALLTDENAIRQSRLTRLKRWLNENPAENIPELQLIAKKKWANALWNQKVGEPLITDEDYRVAIGLIRSEATSAFIPMAFKAVQQYAKANNGQFPGDVSQLKPYFTGPIDDAILQRYEVVPAKSLVNDLAETGGEWLITEKAPVNKDFDQRVAIGLTNWRLRGGGDQWDPVP